MKNQPTVREARAELRRLGWERLRQVGSHELWGRGRERFTLIATERMVHPSMAKRLRLLGASL